ncbi:MAG: mannonate dehydratase, partial [Candidatus Bathyarchaeia archaeon]
MKVSVRLPVLSDEEIIFRKQIGVECVDLYLDVIPGYQKGVLPGFQTVRFDLNDVAKVIRKVKDSGLDVASFYALPIRQALLGHPEGEKQIEDLCEFIRLLGNESVEVAQVGLEEVRHGPTGVPGRYVREHRAGYKMYAFSLKLMREELAKRDLNACWAHHFRDSIKSEEYFSNCVKVLERVIPVAEDSNVKVAIHTDDPP